MADQPQPAKKRKRRVKNPETFRERAVKATAASNQPGRSGRLREGAVRLARPAGRTLGRAGRSKPLKPLRRPARLVGKVLVPPYFRNSWRELRLVTWPNWQESRRLTFAVLVFAIIFGAAIALVDYGLEKVFKSLLLK